MKIIFSFLFLCLSYASFGQAKTPGLSSDEYLQKSQRKKKTAWILAGAGAALIATGLLIPEGEVTGFSVWPDWSETHKNDNVKSALSVTGVFSILASIPFFISSSRNKSRARTSLGVGNQPVLLPRENRMALSSVPGITFKIGL